ncbi:hypothetical protein GEMRC1_001798 [Eukaryota sp. GEM-RC1]
MSTIDILTALVEAHEAAADSLKMSLQKLLHTSSSETVQTTSSTTKSEKQRSTTRSSTPVVSTDPTPQPYEPVQWDELELYYLKYAIVVKHFTSPMAISNYIRCSMNSSITKADVEHKISVLRKDGTLHEPPVLPESLKPNSDDSQDKKRKKKKKRRSGEGKESKKSKSE